MTTMIPPTELNQILQTKSSPETTVALLNRAETTYFKLQNKLHGNARRVYPYWKTCQVCSQPFQCHTKEQATRNKMCSTACRNVVRQANTGPRTPTRWAVCQICGEEFVELYPRRDRPQKYCSYQCNGVVRGEEWKKHAHKGRAAWTAESEALWREKMIGPTNPAWKGGVTYRKAKGNYKGVRYVRCPMEFLAMARLDGYVAEHRLVVAQILGRLLTPQEVVHHCNHDPLDNRAENLMLFASNSDHKLYEHRGTPDPIWPA